MTKEEMETLDTMIENIKKTKEILRKTTNSRRVLCDLYNAHSKLTINDKLALAQLERAEEDAWGAYVIAKGELWSYVTKITGEISSLVR
jgi:hypothetical protein